MRQHTIHICNETDSWFFYGQDIEENDELYIYGNKDFSGINEDAIKSILRLEDDYWEFENGYYKNITDYITDYLPKKKNKAKLSTLEIHKLHEAIKSYDNFRYASDYRQNLICEALKIIHGKDYEVVKIRGCSQGDYNFLYHPKNTSQKMINYIEAVYFNTGYEVQVDNEECFYTDEWKEEEIKKEAAEYLNCSVDEIEVEA